MTSPGCPSWDGKASSGAGNTASDNFTMVDGEPSSDPGMALVEDYDAGRGLALNILGRMVWSTVDFPDHPRRYAPPGSRARRPSASSIDSSASTSPGGRPRRSMM